MKVSDFFNLYAVDDKKTVEVMTIRLKLTYMNAYQSTTESGLDGIVEQ
jgi:hypothetical protein